MFIPILCPRGEGICRSLAVRELRGVGCEGVEAEGFSEGVLEVGRGLRCREVSPE